MSADDLPDSVAADSHIRDEGMMVFDVGANVGELTLRFSRFVGAGGSVHTFESAGHMKEATSYAQRFMKHVSWTNSRGEEMIAVWKLSAWQARGVYYRVEKGEAICPKEKISPAPCGKTAASRHEGEHS